MTLFLDKFKEVFKTLIPVVIVVILLSLTIVDLEHDVMARFLIGSTMLLFGLSFFLWGIDLSMNPIGTFMSKEVATSRTLPKILILSFLLGFLITVAEPDLLILGTQIDEVSGHSLSAILIVAVVSIGVGLMIALGILRLLRGKPQLNTFMMVWYFVIMILAFLASESYLAIAFDASGATTGALTTPFVLALTLGLSQTKGGAQAEENSFGLVGVMSAGPILSVLLLSLRGGSASLAGNGESFTTTVGILKPIIDSLPHTLFESLIALLPIATLFFLFNAFKFHIPKVQLLPIIKGLLLTLFGLVIFLDGVNAGFLETGRIIGMQIAAMDTRLLIILGFILGLVIVLMEPAVHVLSQQIEEVTAGHISVTLIKVTLCIGVALAVMLSMIRITTPSVKLWYFLLPSFALAIILSFRSNPVFVGIAYDAGGVASGPMTATFILAFAQGAAYVIPTADVMADGFGVIAMVASAPVLAIMALGTAYRIKQTVQPKLKKEQVAAKPAAQYEMGALQTCVLVVVDRGYSDSVVALAREHGATGATILHGRGTDGNIPRKSGFMHLDIQPEKEILLLVTAQQLSLEIARQLATQPELVQQAHISVHLCPTDALVKALPASIKSNT